MFNFNVVYFAEVIYFLSFWYQYDSTAGVWFGDNFNIIELSSLMSVINLFISVFICNNNHYFSKSVMKHKWWSSHIIILTLCLLSSHFVAILLITSKAGISLVVLCSVKDKLLCEFYFVHNNIIILVQTRTSRISLHLKRLYFYLKVKFKNMVLVYHFSKSN